MAVTINGTTGVGVSTTPLFPVDVAVGTLGNTVNSQLVGARLLGTAGANSDTLEISQLRGTAGTDWQTAGWRLQERVDATWKGYIQFNGTASGANNDGISFGTGSSATPNGVTERLRIDGTGNVTATGNITTDGNMQAASHNDGQLAGLRNKIINGNMGVAQRGTVSSGISTVTYTLDRWIVFTGGAALSVSQTAGDGALFQYALNLPGAVGNTSCNVTQRIEQRNAYPLASKQVTVSARIFASASFTPTWSVDSANTADTFSATTNVATGTFSAMAIGWNDVTLTTTLNAACQNGFQVSFLMGATTTGNKGLTGVQLEVGPVATPFEQRPIGMELALCQRYFSFVYVGFRFPSGTGAALLGAWTVTLPVTMRVNPITLTLGGSPTNSNVATETLSNVVSLGTTTFSYQLTATAASTDTFITNRLITAAAEL